MKRRNLTDMQSVWLDILIAAWGLGMLLMLAEMRGSFHKSLTSLIRHTKGDPALQLFFTLVFIAACLLPVLLWPLYVIADIFTKKPEEGEQ